MARNRYEQIIERLFFDHYKEGAEEVAFDREEIVPIARQLEINLPKNLGDIIYSLALMTVPFESQWAG